MNRLSACVLSFTIAAFISACSLNKQSPTTQTNNQPAQTASAQPTKSEPVQQQAQAGDLQPGQANGTYTAKGEVVELKYAYAGRATRFGTPSLVVLLTDKPIPPEAVAEEIKSATLLEADKVRGLEYVFDDNGVWVRYHPSQYQESGSNKLKEYKVENEMVRGIDEDDGSMSGGKYSRSVRFVAAIAK